MAEETTSEPTLEVTPVNVKPSTVNDPDPDNDAGEVIVYEEDGSWHKTQKVAE